MAQQNEGLILKRDATCEVTDEPEIALATLLKSLSLLSNQYNEIENSSRLQPIREVNSKSVPFSLRESELRSKY